MRPSKKKDCIVSPASSPFLSLVEIMNGVLNLTSHEQSVGVRLDSWEALQAFWNSWQVSGQTVDRIHGVLDTRPVPVITPMSVKNNIPI